MRKEKKNPRSSGNVAEKGNDIFQRKGGVKRKTVELGKKLNAGTNQAYTSAPSKTACFMLKRFTLRKKLRGLKKGESRGQKNLRSGKQSLWKNRGERVLRRPEVQPGGGMSRKKKYREKKKP